MAEERALQAIARIERALARVEAAADRPREQRGDGPDGAELERLREAHHALRGSVQGAIGRIDLLLDGGGRS